jgi:hypothetical protein
VRQDEDEFKEELRRCEALPQLLYSKLVLHSDSTTLLAAGIFSHPARAGFTRIDITNEHIIGTYSHLLIKSRLFFRKDQNESTMFILFFM